MASAGSGKSNTIGWLAHRLSDLHARTDPHSLEPEALASGRIKPGEPVFDKVIVITDRRNLDAQLRENVGSFSQTDGLVVKVDEKHGAKSEQLARALSRDTGKIVTVTLHSFPALLDYIKRNPTEIKGTRLAIVIDEAHSSQSGDAATAVKSALRELGLDSDSEDEGATTVTLGDKLKGPASESALDSRAQAARCRGELGQVTEALAGLQDVLELVRAIGGDVSEDAVELRRDIGMLLLAQGRTADAFGVLDPLHADLCMVLGPDDELTAEVAETLAVIRLDLDGGRAGSPT
jgi:hypothetical protein